MIVCFSDQTVASDKPSFGPASFVFLPSCNQHNKITDERDGAIGSYGGSETCLMNLLYTSASSIEEWHVG